MRKKEETSIEKAKDFYLLAKSRLGQSRVSPIYPLNLRKLSELEYTEFSEKMRELAKQDGLEAVILRHEELSDDDKRDLPRLLSLDNDGFIRTEAKRNKKNPKNRIYLQLQIAAL